MENHLKKEITKKQLRKILLQKNSGELISVIISLRISYRKVQNKYLVDEILNFARTNKETLESELKYNLGLNIKIINDVSPETKASKT